MSNMSKFEIAVLWLLHFASINFETRNNGNYKVFDAQVSSLEESWALAKKVGALAMLHCASNNLTLSIELDNGIGEKEEMWFRRWSFEKFETSWNETSIDRKQSFVWVTADGPVSYGIYLNVR